VTLRTQLLALAYAIPAACAESQPARGVSHLGSFLHEEHVGFIRFERRLIVSEAGVEYWSRATENGRGGTQDGREQASQRCTATLHSVQGRPVMGAMVCETFANGSRKSRSVDMKLQYNGTTWIRVTEKGAQPFLRRPQ
jgi:hypothetical protein